MNLTEQRLEQQTAQLRLLVTIGRRFLTVLLGLTRFLRRTPVKVTVANINSIDECLSRIEVLLNAILAEVTKPSSLYRSFNSMGADNIFTDNLQTRVLHSVAVTNISERNGFILLRLGPSLVGFKYLESQATCRLEWFNLKANEVRFQTRDDSTEDRPFRCNVIVEFSD